MITSFAEVTHIQILALVRISTKAIYPVYMYVKAKTTTKPHAFQEEKVCISTDKIFHYLTAEWTYRMDSQCLEFISGFIQAFLVHTNRASLP